MVRGNWSGFPESAINSEYQKKKKGFPWQPVDYIPCHETTYVVHMWNITHISSIRAVQLQ